MSKPPEPGARGDRNLLWAVVAFGLIAATIKLIAYRRFGTGFDTAVLGNVAWRLGNGFDDVTPITGYPHFATHASVVIFLLAGVFRVAPTLGLPVTFILQAASVALVGFALWGSTAATAMEYRQRRWLVLVTLLSPVAFLATRFEVYEPILGLGALAMTVSAGHQRQKTSRCWWWPTIAASCRIEMAISTIVAGLLLIRRPDSRRLGFLSCVLGAAGALVSLWLAISAGADATSFGAHFSHLGTSLSEAAAAIVARPVDALRPLGEPTMIASLALSLLPWGLLPALAGWRYLFLALPLAGVAIFGTWEPADFYFHHYWFGFLVGGSFATAEFLRKRPQLFPLTWRLSLVGMAAAWLAMIPAWPILTPFGPAETPQYRAINEFVISSGSLSVSTPTPVLVHLIDRPTLYFFPRPFMCLEEGIGQFRWNGSPPELVIVTDSQAAFVEISPWREVLAARYQKVASPPGTHAWTLTEAGVFSNECVEVTAISRSSSLPSTGWNQGHLPS